jgi:uncharacterized membrane protein
VWLALIAAGRQANNRRLPVVQLAWATGGLLVVFYLIYAELFLIGAICLWCTAVHASVIALFLFAVAEVSSEMTLTGEHRRSGNRRIQEGGAQHAEDDHASQAGSQRQAL